MRPWQNFFLPHSRRAPTYQLEHLHTFLREGETPLVYPEKLDLTQDVGPKAISEDQRSQRLFQALTKGDEQKARFLILNAYLGGEAIETLFDEWILQAFRDVGCAREPGQFDMAQERKSCEICLSILHDLGEFLPDPETDAPLAIGGTMTGGQALNTDLRRNLRYTVFCDTLTHMVTLLHGIDQLAFTKPEGPIP